MRKTALLLTCEHGDNKIPSRFHDLFARQQKVLATHRGWDLGALDLAKSLAKCFAVPLYYSEVSRLLIDLNRSLHHKRLWSEFTRDLPREDKSKTIDLYYQPHRQEVAKQVEILLKKHSLVVHVAIHSFTPILNHEKRNADVGILYDPQRRQEKELSALWYTQLKELAPELRVRKNYPYKGATDCFPHYLRTCFLEKQYIGIELETMNSCLQNKKDIRYFTDIYYKSLSQILAKIGGYSET